MNSVVDNLASLFVQQEVIVVACSGGPDSMFLMETITKIKKDLKVIVAHVNHNKRKQSEIEYEFVKKYAHEHNYIFEGIKIENWQEENFQQQARRKRYEFFSNLIEKYQAKYLLTAHHGDDLVETILMRIARGSDLKGYYGFKEISSNQNYNLLRPLIRMTKKEIIAYMDEHKLTYFNDITNESEKYTRNRYRKNILPFLKEECPKIHHKYLEFSETLQEIDSLIDKLTDDALTKIYDNDKLVTETFNQFHKVIKRNVLYQILKKIYGKKIYLIEKKHIEYIFETLNKSGSREINLPENYLLVKNDKYFTIEKKQNKILKKTCLEEYSNIIRIKDSKEVSNYIVRLDSRELACPLFIRSRQNGDRITIKTMEKEKLISDIFINEKISRNKRINWPILVDNNDNILWIPGVKKSKFDKDKTDYYDIILEYCEGEK